MPFKLFNIVFLFVFAILNFGASAAAPASLNQSALSKLAPVDGLAPPQYLPVDTAFELAVTREQGQLRMRWLIQPGYYLYRDRLSFSGIKVDVETLPQGVVEQDEIFGEVEVYLNELVILAPISPVNTKDGNKVSVSYQGCAVAGLCYPAQTRIFELNKL